VLDVVPLSVATGNVRVYFTAPSCSHRVVVTLKQRSLPCEARQMVVNLGGRSTDASRSRPCWLGPGRGGRPGAGLGGHCARPALKSPARATDRRTRSARPRAHARPPRLLPRRGCFLAAYGRVSSCRHPHLHRGAAAVMTRSHIPRLAARECAPGAAHRSACALGTPRQRIWSVVVGGCGIS
jgi:hypothetical protein